jgi:opacity protein-like surface antigen
MALKAQDQKLWGTTERGQRMKKITTIIVFILFTGLTAQFSYGQRRYQDEDRGTVTVHAFKVGVGGGFYSFSESIIKDLYGSGAPIFAGSLTLELIKNLEFRGEYNYLQKEGAMSVSEEELKITFKDIVLEARFKFFSKKKVSPYICGGIDFISFKEDYPERFDDFEDKTNGYHFGAGAYFRLSNKFNLDFNVRYVKAEVEPFEEVIQLGGIRAGIGIEIRL